MVQGISKSTSATTPSIISPVEPPAVKAMKEALKKHGSNNNGNGSSPSFLKRNGNNHHRKKNNSGGTGTAGSTPPKENNNNQERRRRSSPTHTTNQNDSSSTTTAVASVAAHQEKNNKIRASSPASSSPTNKSNIETTRTTRSPLATPLIATSAAAAAADNNCNDKNDHVAAAAAVPPPSSTLAMRTPLQLLRTSRSAIEATTSASSRSLTPNSSLRHLVSAESTVMLRRQSSLPATPSSSIVVVNANAASNNNGTTGSATTTTLHRLDRFGFIVNMDRHGNILPHADGDDGHDDDDDDGRRDVMNDHARVGEIQPGSTAIKSNGRGLHRGRNENSGGSGGGGGAALSSQSSSAVAVLKRTKKREQKWQFMMDHWSVSMSNLCQPQGLPTTNHHNPIATRRRRKVITRLRKGLPDKYRGMVWKLLGNVPQKLKENVGLYQLLVQRATHSFSSTAAPTTTSTDHHNTSNDHSTATTAGTTVSTGSSGGGAVGNRNNNARNLPDTVEVGTDTDHDGALLEGGNKSIGGEGGITGPSSVRHSKSFRNIQDTIERDIHRTFPRHSMFYEEEKNHGNNILPHTQGGSSGGGSGRVASSIGGGLLADFSASHFSEEDNLMLCGIGSEISETMRELERGAAGAASAVTATVGAAVAATNAATTNLGDNGLLLTTEQRQQQQQQQQRDLVNNDDSDNPSPETILQSVGGQASLRRVLKAYSLYDRDIGYCQGMNFIAGMFLTLMSEEEAFWLLVDIMNEPPCKMRGLFGEGMSETHQVLHVAEKLIQQFLPKLSKHFDRELIHVTMFATQWLLTQYTSSFKFDLVTRVWDCFLAEGWKITYRVMLALLKQWEGEIVKMSFEDILAFFRELPERIDDIDALMELAFKIPLRRSHIAKYEKEWGQMQQQQQAQSRI